MRLALALALLFVAFPARADDHHWYFDALSSDGKRALLRELDPNKREGFHARVVDVDSGATVDELTLDELGKIPTATIGGQPTELARLEWMLASPPFGSDLVRGARIASQFPFGACGRLASAKGGAVISFDAGDWLYAADGTGRVEQRLVDEAAYDPRFTPDGKSLLFRRAVTSGTGTQYELFAIPSDLSAAPKQIGGTAGMRDRFVAVDGQSAVAISSTAKNPQQPHGARETCVVSLGLKAPFTTKKLACLDGGEQLVESVISPKGKWAAISTKVHSESGGVAWRLRVVSLSTGKILRDEPDVPGLSVRAMSDSGFLVLSGSLGIVVHDIPGKKWHSIDRSIDLGSRGFFRNDKDLVYVRDGTVAVLDVSKE